MAHQVNKETEMAQQIQKEKEMAHQINKETEMAQQIQKEKEMALQIQREKEVAQQIQKEKKMAQQMQEEKEMARQMQKEKEMLQQDKKEYIVQKQRQSDEVKDAKINALAFLGCDTTSRIYGIGKGSIVKKFKDNVSLQQAATIFNDPNSTHSQVQDAGATALLIAQLQDKPARKMV